jgi:cyanate permease
MAGLAGFSLFSVVNCVCGGFAFLALLLTFRSTEPSRPNADAVPSGVGDIMRSKEFLSLAVVYGVVGVQFTGATSLIGVVLPEKFGFSEWQVAVSFIVMTVVHFLLMANLKGLTAKFGTPTLIISSYSLAILGHVLFLFKFSFKSLPSTLFLFLISTLVLPLAMTGANMLAPGVADKYGENARGATIGMLRTTFNVGQAIGPAFAVSLYNVKNELNDGFVFFALQGAFMAFATACFAAVWVLGKGKDGEWAERGKQKVGMEKDTEVEMRSMKEDEDGIVDDEFKDL